MSRARPARRRMVGAAAALAVGLLTALAPSLGATDEAASGAVEILRIHVGRDADVTPLLERGVDLVESRTDDYLLAVGDESVAAQLRRDGYRVTIDRQLPAQRPIGGAQGATTAETYAAGYRTVAEHYQHLDTVVANYPALATTVDYGDSWKKTTGQGGADLRALCITNRQAGDCALAPGSTKPRFLMMAAIHARELSTSELAYRWIDYLTQNYNTNADVTWLVNNTELWVVPVVNPDGRVVVEAGGNAPYLQRKNVNNTAPGSSVCANPPTVSSQVGVDLNRNASTPNWGGLGTSTNPCDQTFKGASAASEPEQQALQQLFSQLFPDTKGPARTDAAATTTRGAMVSLHSYANLVLLPYGDAKTGGYAPNDTALRSLAFRMSYFNGYQAGTGDEVLYATTGTTDDWIYGTLGVPGFTIEVGPSSGSCSGFTPAYSCQDSTFWPKNLSTFLYLAKAAASPYVTALGPTSSAVAVNSASVTLGTSVTLTANVNDAAFGTFGPGASGRPNPTGQAISGARYAIDALPTVAATTTAMTAADGAFNATSENVRASVPTSALTRGRHTLYVQGKDSAGNWGTISAVFLTVT